MKFKGYPNETNTSQISLPEPFFYKKLREIIFNYIQGCGRKYSRILTYLASLSSLVSTVGFEIGSFFFGLTTVRDLVRVFPLALVSSDCVLWSFGLLVDFLGRPRFLTSWGFGLSVCNLDSSTGWRVGFSTSDWWSLSLRRLIIAAFLVLFRASSNFQSFVECEGSLRRVRVSAAGSDGEPSLLIVSSWEKKRKKNKNNFNMR